MGKEERQKTAVSRWLLNVFEGLYQNRRRSRAESSVLTLPKYCQKCSFQLSRQSCVSHNNISFFSHVSCDKEDISMLMQKKRKIAGGRVKS